MNEEVFIGKLDLLNYGERRAIMIVEDPKAVSHSALFTFPEIFTETVRELWGKRVIITRVGAELQGIKRYRGPRVLRQTKG